MNYPNYSEKQAARYILKRANKKATEKQILELFDLIGPAVLQVAIQKGFYYSGGLKAVGA